MKFNDIFIEAVVTERDGGFYIRLHNRIVKEQPDYHIKRRFESRAEAETWGEIFARMSNEMVCELGEVLAPPGWQSPS